MTKKKPREKQRKTNQNPRKIMNYLYREPKIPSTANNNDSRKGSVGFTFLPLDSFNSSTTHAPCADCDCPGSPSNRGVSHGQHPKKPKSLFLESRQTTTTTDVHSLQGFSVITLPSTSSLHNTTTQSHAADTASPALRRCSSDPCSTPVVNLVAESPVQSSKMVEANAVSNTASKGSALPQLRRSVPDVSPNKSHSRSSSSNDMSTGMDGSPSYEWLRKMRDSMKEINQLWDEIMPDAYQEVDKGTQENITNAMKNDSVANCEEAVWVEKTGKFLIIHFKCPCGEAYQVLVSGRSCFYKLM